MWYIIKKDGRTEEYNRDKIKNAIQKSANRALYEFNDNEKDKIVKIVEEKLTNMDIENISVYVIHSLVENALDEIVPIVAKSYKDYRNYKKESADMLDGIYHEANRIQYLGDKENANTDSTLVSTKRSLILNELNKELYKKFQLNPEEVKAIYEGYIYIHDMSARRDTMNCFRRDTRFITKDGIKSFYDFSDGDTTMVLSHRGIWRRAVVHKYGWQPIQKVTIQKGTPTSIPREIYCTPDHRWILKDGSYTTNLSVGDVLWQVPDITVFDWNTLSLEDKKLWCKGFAKGDGALVSAGKNYDRPPYIVLRLCGHKVEYVDRFRECGYNVTPYADDENDLLVHMLDCTTKDIPWLSLNYNNILYYINGLMCADGHRRLGENPLSQFRGIQVTGDLNNDIQDLLNIAGYYVTSYRNLTGQVTNYGVRNEITISYGISSCQSKNSAWRVVNIEPANLNPKAEVWCLEVDEDQSFLLEGGIPTGNCCLFRLGDVMRGGFEMSNVWYNEPKTVDTAFDVGSDVIISAASQQYGGFTIPRVDTIMSHYAEKSYNHYLNKYISRGISRENAEKYADEDTKRDIAQSYQGWEMKFNTVSSSRGDYPFITITFGIDTSYWGKEISKIILNVHKEGQGKPGNKKPVLFPKLVFLYDENLHGPGCSNEDVFEAGIECSNKTMYPDWLSLTGDGYISSMYKQYGEVISPMGCRAFLSPYWINGGQIKEDENDTPIFEGRFNVGAISLHLPMILAKSREENRDFYEVLDYYLEMIRSIHCRTYEYLGKMKASCNPLAYCEGGFYKGNLDYNDTIAPLLDYATASFGITALNELQQLYNKKSLVEDGEFAIEVLKYINKKKDQFTKEDHHLYAIYGTPAESLCFSPNEIVQTYGGNKMIKDIVPGDLVYSFNEEKHKIELKRVLRSGITRRNSPVVKVTFDTGQEVICTPDHPFATRKMLRNGHGNFMGETIEYVPASLLQPGTRIKSNYIYINKHGRPECSIYHNGQKQLIHDINAEYFYGPKPEGYVVHHEDEDKQNNLYYNLTYMTDADHRRHHIGNIIDYCYKSENVMGENNPFYGKHHTDEAKLANRLAHLDPDKAVVRTDLNNNIIEEFECLEDVQRAGYTRHMALMACKGKSNRCYGSHTYKDSNWYFRNDYEQFYGEELALAAGAEMNHKVVSVELLNELIDVYDITVEDNHNFFVGGDAGILVHNCGLQIKQFRAKYGIIENVSDREYVSNSFHCHVTEDITPIQKQDFEGRFWELSNGGKIQYVKYPINYNKEAVKTLVRRAMKLGYYEGVNLSLAYCNNCGYEELNMDVCPKCGSTDLTKIDRMNGYLSYSRVRGESRLNDAKMAEIRDRKSM